MRKNSPPTLAQAPTGRNSSAQANGLGRGQHIAQALKGRDKHRFMPQTDHISPLQGLIAICSSYPSPLGWAEECPALQASMSHHKHDILLHSSELFDLPFSYLPQRGCLSKSRVAPFWRYPGIAPKAFLPQRGCVEQAVSPFCRGIRNPVGVGTTINCTQGRHVPRQPWASFHNPFGVKIKGKHQAIYRRNGLSASSRSLI